MNKSSSVDSSPLKKTKRRIARILEDSDDEEDINTTKTTKRQVNEEKNENKNVKENGERENNIMVSPQKNRHSPSRVPTNGEVYIPKRKTGKILVFFWSALIF